MRANAFGSFRAVRVDVAAVEGGHRVAAIDGLLEGPDVQLAAAAAVGRVLVRHAGAILRHPTGGHRHVRIVDQCVVAAEVHTHKRRRRRFPFVRHHQQQMHARRAVRTEVNDDFLLGGFAVEVILVHAFHGETQFGRRRGLSIHVVLEEGFQFRAALVDPLPFGLNRLTAEHH